MIAKRYDWMVRKHVAFAGVGFVLTVSIALLSHTPLVRAWSGDVTLYTTTVQPGTNTHLAAGLVNTWSRDIYVNAVNLSIDWPGGPMNLSASGLPTGLGPGAGTNVQWLVSVPSGLSVGARYNVTIDVNATERNANGTWGDSSTKSWMFQVTIQSIIIDDEDGHIIIFPGIDISTPFGLFCLGLAIFVIVVLLLLIILFALRRRKKNP